MPEHLVLASGTCTDGVAIGNTVGLELFLFQNSKQMQCLHPQEAGGCPQLWRKKWWSWQWARCKATLKSNSLTIWFHSCIANNRLMKLLLNSLHRADMWCLPSVQRPWFLPWLQCEVIPYSVVSFLGQIVAFRLQDASMWVIYILYLYTCIYNNNIQYTHRAFWHNLAYAYHYLPAPDSNPTKWKQTSGDWASQNLHDIGNMTGSSISMNWWEFSPKWHRLIEWLYFTRGAAFIVKAGTKHKLQQRYHGTEKWCYGELLLQVLQSYSRYLDYTIRWTDIWKTYSQARISGHTCQKHFTGLKRMVAVRASQ